MGFVNISISDSVKVRLKKIRDKKNLRGYGAVVETLLNFYEGTK